jgi:hypothetical protein
MPMSFQRGLPLCAVAALALASLPATAQVPQGGAGGPARQDMQRCVGGVLSQLARSQSPETLVGPTVVSRCDRQLRAALQEAIKTGEAGSCSVDSCLASARQRASEQAVLAYRSFRR